MEDVCEGGAGGTNDQTGLIHYALENHSAGGTAAVMPLSDAAGNDVPPTLVEITHGEGCRTCALFLFFIFLQTIRF